MSTDSAVWLREQAALWRQRWEGWHESIVGDDAERLDAAAGEIDRLRALFIEAACEAGWNDPTQRKLLGDDAYYAAIERGL